MKTKLAKGIALSSITVSDINKAKALFVDLIGLDIKEFAEEFKWMELGGSEGPRIGIGEYCDNKDMENPLAGSNAIISILVDNVVDGKQYLESNGVEFLGEILEIPNEVKLAMFKDFDGNKFFLTEKLS